MLTGPNGAVGLPNKKLSGLLAYLACTAPEPQPRKKLSTLFWGSYFDAQAKQNLRQSLFKLRQILGRDALKSDGEFVSLNTTVILCDVSRFEVLVREGGRDALGEAADLYRGRFVDDIGVTEEGWSDWLAGERQRFQELALTAMVGLGEKELAAGRADHALKAGHRASALNNMREDAHRLIMQALSATGRKAEALKYYQEVVTLLKRELNTEPDEATRALVAELRRAQTLIESVAVSEVEISAPLAPALMMVADQPSIVVLPFRNMSDDPEQEYFADGVTEDIITALSRFREFVVIARGSSFAFKDRRLTSRQIALQLGVQYVLSGNIRKAGNRIRVSAELTHARDEAQVWSDRYDRAIVDVFDLQDDISASVAAVIDPAVRSAEVERARRKPLSDLSAYDIYLRALPYLWSGTRDGITRAIVLLRQSLTLDQLRPATLASLAWALVMASPLGAAALPETLVEALALARRAVEEDGTNAFAHAVYGFTLFGPVGNNDQGRIHCKEAVRLNPSSAFAWGILGMIDSMGGDYEHAVTCLHRSIALSPYDNMLHFWMTGLAASCFALRRPEDGILWARNSIQQNPANGTGHRMLVANLVDAGRLEEARDVTRQRDAVQKTTIAELRVMRFFKQDAALERYLSVQHEAGVTD